MPAHRPDAATGLLTAHGPRGIVAARSWIIRGEDPAVSVASAVVLYLAAKRSRADGIRDPDELIRLAVRAKWHGDPPTAVEDWVTARGVDL